MQKKRSKNLRRNTSEIWKIQQDKNARKKHLEEKNCQEDLQRENYSDGQTRGMTKNTRVGQREIGDSGKKNNQGEEK